MNSETKHSTRDFKTIEESKAKNLLKGSSRSTIDITAIKSNTKTMLNEYSFQKVKNNVSKSFNFNLVNHLKKVDKFRVKSKENDDWISNLNSSCETKGVHNYHIKENTIKNDFISEDIYSNKIEEKRISRILNFQDDLCKMYTKQNFKLSHNSNNTHKSVDFGIISPSKKNTQLIETIYNFPSKKNSQNSTSYFDIKFSSGSKVESKQLARNSFNQLLRKKSKFFYKFESNLRRKKITNLSNQQNY